MRLALYEPEIAGNVGAVMRLGACFGVDVDLIEPMGFGWDDRRVRRAAMDYVEHVQVIRHKGFVEFHESVTPRRLVLFTTKGQQSLHAFRFEPDDVLLFGKESAGVPASVSSVCDALVRIPIRRQVRSLNLAIASAVALGEGLRQTGGI
ncbi:MAG: tRNA methyltransferase, partial [Novosphingobium sp. 35-62-5]